MTEMQSTLAAANRPFDSWLRALANTNRLKDEPSRTLSGLLDELAGRFGSKPALVAPSDQLTYAELAERAHQYSRWALEQGIEPGDAVSLLMRNCAEYAAIWLGITHIGGCVALINTNLRGKALLHSLTIAGAKHLIVGDDLVEAARDVVVRLPQSPRLWTAGPGSSEAHDFPTLRVTDFSGAPLRATEAPTATTKDRALYIYTSGTTGLPKAANISHFRLLEWSYWFAGMMDTGPDDRMYNCLPMYHSTGGVVAIGAVLVHGGTVIIRDKFSATQFWEDVATQRCTLFQYIGELCRYLLNSPSHPQERRHNLRLCCGNGLREEVWTAFQNRFNVPRILEFYASTEGNVSLYNCEGKPGAIGRVPPFLASRFPVALVRCDGAGQPVRNATGLCSRAAVGETGEAIGLISAGSGAEMSAFDGYTDAAASLQKVLRDVFTTGDAWFRTGDLMRRDSSGFFYFVDRVGDTFRWKGENVSTAQVAEVAASCPGVTQAVVYGVALPHVDGKAGMAAIVVTPTFSLCQFWHHLAAHLPDAARPVALRLCESLPTTGTFKPVSAELAATGFDPDRISDPLYFNDSKQKAFVPLDSACYAAILRGDIRV